MTLGQHGALLPSPGGRARVMHLANGTPSLGLLATSSSACLPNRVRAVTRRYLYIPSKMPTGSSKHPPNWKLWHPNNGVVFQQPLYPVLDFARFFTETWTTRETAAADTENSLRTESTATIEESFTARRFDEENITYARLTERTVRMSSMHNNHEGIRELQREEALGEKPIRASEIAGDQDAAAEEQGEISADDGTVSPPFTPLDYKLQSDAFQAAKAAPEGSTGSFWSYSFYRGPNEQDDVRGKVRVHYCKNAHVAERALQYLLEEKAIGLDLEWLVDAHKYSGARRNVSLVQLASQSRVILLHLALYPSKDELATPTLRKILEDPNITKLGVWIKGDCTRIKKWLGIETRSIFELSHLFKQVKYCSSGQHGMINKRLISLASQVEEVMGLPMFKEQSVRTSDWTQPLNIAQIGYSASDAYAAVQLFAMLNYQREQLNPAPALPFHADLDKPIPLPNCAKVSSTDEAKTAAEPADEAELEAMNGQEELEEIRAEVLELLEDVKASLQNVATQDEDDNDIPIGKLASKASKGKANADKAPAQPKDPRIESADAWAAEYRATKDGKIKTVPAALRAYHIWYSNADMDPNAVARLLREPPLKTTTVVAYILAALQHERLPYDKTRAETEIVPLASHDALRSRFKSFFRALGPTPRE